MLGDELSSLCAQLLAADSVGKVGFHAPDQVQGLLVEQGFLQLGLVMRVRVSDQLSDSVLSRGFVEGHGSYLAP